MSACVFLEKTIPDGRPPQNWQEPTVEILEALNAQQDALEDAQTKPIELPQAIFALPSMAAQTPTTPFLAPPAAAPAPRMTPFIATSVRGTVPPPFLESTAAAPAPSMKLAFPAPSTRWPTEIVAEPKRARWTIDLMGLLSVFVALAASMFLGGLFLQAEFAAHPTLLFPLMIAGSAVTWVCLGLFGRYLLLAPLAAGIGAALVVTALWPYMSALYFVLILASTLRTIK